MAVECKAGQTGLSLPIGQPLLDLRIKRRVGYWNGTELVESVPMLKANGGRGSRRCSAAGVLEQARQALKENQVLREQLAAMESRLAAVERESRCRD